MSTLFRSLAFIGFICVFSSAAQSAESIKGTYRTILEHDQNGYYQHATITLSTVNTGDGNLKISASVRMLFGDINSNEFLTYEYPDCPLNILTRQISLKDQNNGVSFVGFLKNGSIQGDWYSPTVGRVGGFVANKTGQLPVPTGKQMVRSVTGHYTGVIRNTNPASNPPENVTVSLVTVQDPQSVGNRINVSGNMRLYFGDPGSNEYVETKFASTELNFYSRYLTAKTNAYGITLKGVVGPDGVFKADVYADGLGLVGKLEVVSR